jgi:hypothetical protein
LEMKHQIKTNIQNKMCSCSYCYNFTIEAKIVSIYEQNQ